MFGIGGKKQGPQPVGAKEKIMKAQMLKRGKLGDHIESRGEGKKPVGPTVVLIYILSVGLAFTLQIGAMKNNGLPLHTGMTGFDNLMFSAGVPSITGDASEDQFIVPALRGLIFFLAGGFMPLITLLWIRAIDKPNMNPFLAFWGVTVGSLFVFFFTRDFFGPLLMQTLDIMSGPGN